MGLNGTIMIFKLHDSAHHKHLPKWNARIYRAEAFMFTPEEFFGQTEEEARLKARKYLREISSDDYRARMAVVKPAAIKAESAAPGDSHHFAGKVWLWHAAHGFKRVDPAQVDGMIAFGWIRRGPRSKAE